MLALHPDRIRRYAGWSAYVSASLAVIGDVALFLFYALEAPHVLATGGTSSQFFGPLSDNAGLFSSIFMLPLPVALHQLTAQRWRGLSWAAIALGVLGLLTTIIAQILLVARVISFAVNLPFTLGGLVLLGVWMILANHLGRASGTLSPRLAWLGELTGTALASEGGLVFLLVLASALNPALVTHLGTLAPQAPALIGAAIVLAIPGLLAYFLGVPIWLIGLGRRLLATTPTPARSERLLARADTSVGREESWPDAIDRTGDAGRRQIARSERDSCHEHSGAHDTLGHDLSRSAQPLRRLVRDS